MTRVYCDKMAEAKITQFSLNVQCVRFSVESCTTKLEGSLNGGGMVFNLAALYYRNGATTCILIRPNKKIFNI